MVRTLPFCVIVVASIAAAFQNQPPRDQFSAMLMGRVLTEDGTPPPEPASISVYCRDGQGQNVLTDDNGRFTLVINRTPGVHRFVQDFHDCQVRASLQGFRPTATFVAVVTRNDRKDAGLLVLARVSGSQDRTVSATAYSAPAAARKAFEKGTDLAHRGRSDEARQEFEKAVEIYPKYAAAWYELGQLQHKQQHIAEARAAYEHAIAADDMFIKPYLQKMVLEARDSQWTEAAAASARAIHLDPVDFPEAYFFNGLALFRLGQDVAAEKSAREAVRLDSTHRFPQSHHLLGVILAERHDLTGAAEQFRAYLEHAPDPNLAAAVRQQLAEIEKRLPQ